MPIASPEVYAQMLDRAKEGGFAYPAISVTSSETLAAALRGFAEAQSDGIVQVTSRGAEYWSGSTVRDPLAGSLAMAACAREVARNYGVTVALHTDSCTRPNLGRWLEPLLEREAAQVQAGGEPWFQSHTWDGSALPLARNIDIAAGLLARARAAHAVLEVEVGVIAGEGEDSAPQELSRYYSTPEDAMRVVDALGLGERGRYLASLTFGNVRGVYRRDDIPLRPQILGQIQREVGGRTGRGGAPFDLVMHGGSGTSAADLRAAVAAGVVKVNIDTDTQYCFTRQVADWVLRNYDGVLKVDGASGRRALFDPRAWGAQGEAGMARRVALACEQLGSAGRKLG